MNRLYKLIISMFFVVAFSVLLWSDKKNALAQTGYGTSGQTIANIYNTGDMIITEIHPQTIANCLDEYVVIQSNIYYNGKIELVGFGSSTASVNIYTILETGQKLIITDNIAKLNSGNSNNIYIVSSITLTDTGEPLGIKLGSGVSVDSVVYDKPNPSDKSKFFGSNSGAFRNFSVNGDPTPSNSCTMTQQPTAASSECEVYISDNSDPSKLKFGIRGSYSNICSQGIWTGSNGNIINANCGFELSPKEGYNNLIYKIYSGSQVICQSNYTYYQNTNIVTNCQNNYTIASSSTNPSSSTTTTNNFLPGCGIKLQSTYPLYKEDSVNLAAIKRNSIIYNSNTNYKCFWDYGNGITSQECNPPSQKFSHAGMYNIKLSMTDNNGSTCDTSYSLNLPSKYWMINFIDDEYYMSGKSYNPENFIINYTGSIKSGDFTACDKNYYKLLYEKTKSKYDYFLDLYQISEKDLRYIDSGYVLTGYISDLIGLMNVKSANTTDIKHDLSLYSGESNLQISKIIPNPVGADGSGEYIQIITDYGDVDLKGYYLFYGKKKFPLYGIADETGLDLVDKFGFSNSADCVYLGDDKYIYDTLCYAKPKSGYIYGTGENGDIEDIKNSDKRKFILPLVTNDYESGQLVCGSIKSIDKDLKQIEKLKAQITKLKKTNSDLRSTNAKNRKAYSLRVKKLTAQNKKDKKYYSDKEKFARYDMYIYRNYALLLNAKLKKDYDIVRADQQIQDYNSLLNIGLHNLASGYVDGYYNGQKIKSYDLKKIYKISSGNIYINDIIGLLDPLTNKNYIDQIQYERNKKYIIDNKSIKNNLQILPKTKQIKNIINSQKIYTKTKKTSKIKIPSKNITYKNKNNFVPIDIDRNISQNIDNIKIANNLLIIKKQNAYRL